MQVILRRINSQVEIIVSDNGEGIEQKFLPRLFSRFSQADASTTRREGGLGLGLAIVRHLVELHGGRVRAESAGEGRGATFTVTLPIAAVTPAEHLEPGAQTPESPAEAGRRVDLSGITVLVVDDEEDARVLIRRILEMSGARVVTAPSANDALDLFVRDKPDVLLSDIGMPERDGYQLLAEVRRLPASEGGAVPAIALTAYARSEDSRRALLNGFQRHVPKPVTPDTLLDVVGSVAGIATDSRDGHPGGT